MQSKYILFIIAVIAFFISILVKNSIVFVEPNTVPANWGASNNLQKNSYYDVVEELVIEMKKLQDEVDDLTSKNNVLNAEVNEYHADLIECNVKSEKALTGMKDIFETAQTYSQLFAKCMSTLKGGTPEEGLEKWKKERNSQSSSK